MSTETPIVCYHNPRCSKCRGLVEILTDRGVEFTLYEYLEEGPDEAEIRRVLQALGSDDPRVMMRPKEALYAELGLAEASADQRIAAMAAHPQLIERPIVIAGDRAIVARPPELVIEFLA